MPDRKSGAARKDAKLKVDRAAKVYFDGLMPNDKAADGRLAEMIMGMNVG